MIYPLLEISKCWVFLSSGYSKPKWKQISRTHETHGITTKFWKMLGRAHAVSKVNFCLCDPGSWLSFCVCVCSSQTVHVLCPHSEWCASSSKWEVDEVDVAWGMLAMPEGSRLSGDVLGYTVRKKMIAEVTSSILLLAKQPLEWAMSWKMPGNCLWAVPPKPASWMMWKRRICFSSLGSAVVLYPPYWQCPAPGSVSPQPWARAVPQLSWQWWVPLEHWCSEEVNPPLWCAGLVHRAVLCVQTRVLQEESPVEALLCTSWHEFPQPLKSKPLKAICVSWSCLRFMVNHFLLFWV